MTKENDCAYPATETSASGLSKLELFTAMNVQAMVSSIETEYDYRRMVNLARDNNFQSVSDWIAYEAVKQARATIAALNKAQDI